jgi:aspartyl-tRNA synthetase
MSEERLKDFSHLFEALRAGCPPHAGFAIGFDRLVAVMTGRESVKDVIAFPKSSKGEDMMVKSPARITDAELARYHLQFAKPIPKSKDNSDPLPEEKVDGTVIELPSKA